jgi:ATP-dependent RNA helicase CshB
MKESRFERFNLKPFILDALKELGFFKPTEIQERLIPPILNGESVIGQSQTGTGKTHAYLLPIIESINAKQTELQAIITAPTRELAEQIYSELDKILRHSPSDETITSKLLIGGTDRQKTIDRMKKAPHIIVGTPGRILDIVKGNAINPQTAKTIVVDEADLMLDLGFIIEIDQIASRMPENLQILVFSATIPEKLKPFLKKYMENPRFTHVAPKQATAEKIEHLLIPVRGKDRIDIVTDIAVSFNPYLALIFANTRKKADEVADKLIEKGLHVGRIHGDLNPRERRKMMKQIRDLEFQYVVATDLAARGIDIPGVSHVINYELPTQDIDFFIHRVGRTARAGYSGTSATLYDEGDQETLEKIEKMGVTFKHVEVKGNEWIDLGPRNKRKVRKLKKEDEIVTNAHKLVRKPKKVKPGYKKKRNEEIEKVIRQRKRKNR